MTSLADARCWIVDAAYFLAARANARHVYRNGLPAFGDELGRLKVVRHVLVNEDIRGRDPAGFHANRHYLGRNEP